MLLRKSTVYKWGVLPFLMTFLFVAGMHLDMSAQQRLDGTNMPGNASSSPKSLYTAPTGTFVTPAVAQERLLDAMKNIKAQIAQYPEGSAPYVAGVRRLTYFTSINENLAAGKGVADSIVAGLSAISFNSDNTGATPDVLLAEKNAAIALLRP